MKIGQGPGAERFIATDLVPQVPEFASQPAQKMGVAMVPVGNPGVSKISDIEASAHAASTSALIKLL